MARRICFFCFFFFLWGIELNPWQFLGHQSRTKGDEVDGWEGCTGILRWLQARCLMRKIMRASGLIFWPTQKTNTKTKTKTKTKTNTKTKTKTKTWRKGVRSRIANIWVWWITSRQPTCSFPTVTRVAVNVCRTFWFGVSAKHWWGKWDKLDLLWEIFKNILHEYGYCPCLQGVRSITYCVCWCILGVCDRTTVLLHCFVEYGR